MRLFPALAALSSPPLFRTQTAPGLSSEVSRSVFTGPCPGGPHLLRLNWMAKSDMTCRALFVSTRSMEMEPTCRLKVPEISSPLAFMAGSQTWVKETRNPWSFTQNEPFGALQPGRFVNQKHVTATDTQWAQSPSPGLRDAAAESSEPHPTHRQTAQPQNQTHELTEPPLLRALCHPRERTARLCPASPHPGGRCNIPFTFRRPPSPISLPR